MDADDADAVLTRLGPRAALSHEEAARRLGIQLVSDGARRVTVARDRSRVLAAGWRVHRSDLGPADAEVLDDGTRVTTAVRTVADLARVLPVEQAVAAADSAVRQGLVTAEALLAVLAVALGHGASRLRTVGRLFDGRSESVLESLLRVLLAQNGIPTAIPQYLVRAVSGRPVARVDLCWPGARLIVEADGYAFHSDRQAYRRDRQRLNELERLGWRVLRFTWEDVVGDPQHVVNLVAECLEQRAA